MSRTGRFLLFMSLAADSGLLAQTESSGSRLLDQAVVTASKYPVKLSETGKVLTIISPLQVQRSAGKDLSQLLTEQTGIQVNGAYSNPGKDKSIYTLGAANDYTLWKETISVLNPRR